MRGLATEKTTFETFVGENWPETLMWAEVVRRAISDARGDTGNGIESVAEQNMLKRDATQWLTSTSDRRNSIRWVARLLNIDPDKFQQNALLVYRDRTRIVPLGLMTVEAGVEERGTSGASTSRTHARPMTTETVREIRRLFGLGFSIEHIREAVGRPQSTVSGVTSGRSWKGVE